MTLREFLNKRLPTILGLTILFLALGAGIFLVNKQQFFSLKAGPTLFPNKLRLSNITDNSFTVSWVTDGETTGFLRFGETKEPNITVTDERDQLTDKTGNYLTHYFTVRSLKPETIYYFKLGSGKEIYDNNGEPYQIKTAPVLSSLPEPDPVTGTILSSANGPVEAALVYLIVEDSSVLSTRTLKNGTYSLSLSTIRTSDLKSFQKYDQKTSLVSLEIESGKEIATALVTTDNDNPVPNIILGRNYDFREDTSLQEEESVEKSSTQENHFSLADLEGPTNENGQTQEELVISNPTKEGEKINTTKPEFQGKAPAGVVISIKVESPKTYTGSVTVAEDGTWQWSPPKDLTPGIHKITLSYIDDTGEEKTLTRSFTILAAGESELPSFEATASASKSPSPTPKISPSPSPSVAPRTRMPSTESGIPASGILTPTIFLFIMGIILLLGGLSFKFLKIFLRK